MTHATTLYCDVQLPRDSILPTVALCSDAALFAAPFIMIFVILVALCCCTPLLIALLVRVQSTQVS